MACWRCWSAPASVTALSTTYGARRCERWLGASNCESVGKLARRRLIRFFFVFIFWSPFTALLISVAATGTGIRLPHGPSHYAEDLLWRWGVRFGARVVHLCSAYSPWFQRCAHQGHHLARFVQPDCPRRLRSSKADMHSGLLIYWGYDPLENVVTIPGIEPPNLIHR